MPRQPYKYFAGATCGAGRLMVLFSRVFYVIVGMIAAFRTMGLRNTTSRAWIRLYPVRPDGVQNRFDWRMWLPFWAVFFIGCAMAVVVASSGERNPEGLLIIK
ncbi:hypothetical protein QEO92_16705 [Neorhizobium petrolearium]|uniref:Uncharacterized protein n=2 Tax=Neorhizobium TaxID=1525371 RepID=A0ABY8LWE8_9HYPH|nr:hypothetical protein [Neorhizobium petrolearium]WGI66657.1 hypothetical protein QEO92_16705 [Neorhizobium petrolearium]